MGRGRQTSGHSGRPDAVEELRWKVSGVSERSAKGAGLAGQCDVLTHANLRNVSADRAGLTLFRSGIEFCAEHSADRVADCSNAT